MKPILSSDGGSIEPCPRAEVELRLAGAPSGSLRQMVRPELLPVFLMFFFWGFGTGGLWFVRPLFAFETGGTFLLVALMSSNPSA